WESGRPCSMSWKNGGAETPPPHALPVERSRPPPPQPAIAPRHHRQAGGTSAKRVRDCRQWAERGPSRPRSVTAAPIVAVALDIHGEERFVVAPLLRFGQLDFLHRLIGAFSRVGR